MPERSSRLLPSRKLHTGLFGYNRADVQAYLSELEGSERAAVDIWTRAVELERDAVSRARERATTMRDLLHHLERETATLEGQVATAKSTAELLDVGAQHEIYRLEQTYQLRREQLAQLVPAIDRERQKIDVGLRQMMSTIRDTMLQTTAAIAPGIDHDVQFAAVAPVLFGSEIEASQVRARPLAGNRTRLDVPPDRLRAQSRDGRVSGSVTGIVVSGLPPRVLGYIIGPTDDTEKAIAAQDVVAIGQHTVMLKPDARLMTPEELPEMPEGQALRAIARLAAPDLGSVEQAASALSASPSSATSDLFVPLSQTPAQRVVTEPEPSVETRPDVGIPRKADAGAAPSPGLEADPARGEQTLAAEPTEVLPDHPAAVDEPSAPSRDSAAHNDTAEAANSSGPAVREQEPLGVPGATPSRAVSEVAPPLVVPPSVEAPPASAPAQVARLGQPSTAPSLAELAGLLPPPSWQVDVPAAQAGSDLLSEVSPAEAVPPPMTLGQTAPPASTPPIAPPPRTEASAPIRERVDQPPAAPPPPAAVPAPELGGASSSGAVDVLAFLEGKVVGQDIYNSAGELLAAKDMVIDAALVQRVDAAGRLPELIVYMTFPGLSGSGS